MHNHAIIVVDDAARTYYAAPYFQQRGKKKPIGAREARYGEIKGEGYSPDRDCREGEYFFDPQAPLLLTWLRNVGGVSRQSRWNDDGTWNW
jgi:hypothetical protein